MTRPEPGPYGPVPWSEPRPWSLTAYAIVWVVSSVYHFVFVWEGGLRASGGGFSILGWIIPLAILYFLWRGSKIAWWVSLVTTAVGVVIAVGETLEAREVGGHDPILHPVEVAFVVVLLGLLLVPPTRRFYDLDSRGTA